MDLNGVGWSWMELKKELDKMSRTKWREFRILNKKIGDAGFHFLSLGSP